MTLLAAIGAANDPQPLTIYFFLRTDCPISNRYAPDIQNLHQTFSKRGVAFILVYPNHEETPETVAGHVKEYSLPGEIRRDPDHALVKLAGVTVTPEAAVYSGRRLVYRGRIDDRYAALGKARPEPTRRDLAAALEAALAGRPAPAKITRAVGCTISRLP